MMIDEVFEESDVYGEQLVKINVITLRSKWGSTRLGSSMQYMYRVLKETEIPKDAGVEIEFK
jgi:hypothetical protein